MGHFLSHFTGEHAAHFTPLHFSDALDRVDAGGSVMWIIDVDSARRAGTGQRGRDSGSLQFDDQWLDADERIRAHTFVAEQDGHRYTAAHALTRVILGGLTGIAPGDIVINRLPCVRCGEPHGRPELGTLSSGGSMAGQPLRFSTSRSEHLLAIAVRRGSPIGIDIEVRPATESLTALRNLVEAPGDDAGDLLARWVRKEAFLKATGDGLTRPMSSLSLRRHRSGIWRASPDEGLDVLDIEGAHEATPTSAVATNRIVAAIAGTRPFGASHLFISDEA